MTITRSVWFDFFLSCTKRIVFALAFSWYKKCWLKWHLLAAGMQTIKIKSQKWVLAEWRSGSVSALPCERPGFASRTRLREIIPADNCTMQEQNNWGDSPGVMKLWVAWEVLRWQMKHREFCSGGFHPKLVTPPYHGFLIVNTPPNSQNSKRH